MGQNNQKSGGNFNVTVAIRCMAAVFVFYSLYDVVRGFLAGGEEAPSLLLLVLSILVLGGGGVYISLMAWKEWKRGGAAKQQEEPAEQDDPAQLPESKEQ